MKGSTTIIIAEHVGLSTFDVPINLKVVMWELIITSNILCIYLISLLQKSQFFYLLNANQASDSGYLLKHKGLFEWGVCFWKPFFCSRKIPTYL